MIRWLVIAACVLVIFIPFKDSSEDVPPPPQSVDVFDTFCCSYRVLLAEAWEEFAATDFESDAAALDWINQRNKISHQAAFAPVHDRASTAAEQGPEFSAKFAADLRGGTLQ